MKPEEIREFLRHRPNLTRQEKKKLPHLMVVDKSDYDLIRAYMFSKSYMDYIVSKGHVISKFVVVRNSDGTEGLVHPLHWDVLICYKQN